MTVPSVTTNTPITTAWGNSVATDVNLLSTSGRGVLGYVQVTADQGSIVSLVDLTGLSVTVTVAASRRIRITGQAFLISSVTGDVVSFNINEGATGLMLGRVGVTAAGRGATLHIDRIISPSTGSHTYKLQCGRDSGTGIVTMAAATDYLAYIMVEDIGPA